MNLPALLQTNRWSISTRFLAVIAPVLVIIGILTSLWSFVGPTTQLYRQQIVDQTTQLSNLGGQKAGIFLAYKLNALREMSADSAIAAAAVASNAGYAGLSEAEATARLNEREAEWERGGALLNSVRNNPASVRLQGFLESNPGYTEVLVTDRYGGVVATSGGEQDYIDSDEAWFMEAITGVAYLSAPEPHEITGEPMIAIGLPIVSNGEIVGAIQASYAIMALADQLGVPQLRGFGIQRIIDPEGKIIVSPLPEELDQVYAPALAVMEAQGGAITEAGANLEGTGLSDNRSVVASYGAVVSEGLAPLIDAEGLVWWVEVDSSLYFGPLNQNRTSSVVSTVGAMLVLLMLVLFVARYATRDVYLLVRDVEAFAKGDLSKRVSPKGSREVQDLGTAFNGMAEQIETDFHKLQESEHLSRVQNETLIKGNRELAIARRQAEAANKLKSQFLATMSHELRTPLNAIIGYTQLQLAGMVGDLNDELRGFQERIFVNAQHLLHLINDVLDLSKIESGRLDLIERPYNLRDCIDEVFTQNRVLAENKGLKLNLKVDERLPEIVIGDRGRVKQVLINLLSNSIKFTDAGTITVETTLQDNNTWRLAVTDTGIGIPSHLQQTIFDEFRQADEGFERGGTGLGLAIVRRLVLMMDGSIRLSSEVGTGSTFAVTLPMVQTALEDAEWATNGVVEA